MQQSRRKFIKNAGMGLSALSTMPMMALDSLVWDAKGKTKKVASGLWAVMITPFDENLNIDYPALNRMIQWYEEAGVTGFFANCASSEMYQLSPEERLALTQYVVEHTKKPVVSTGTFSRSVEENISFIKQIHETGVDGVVLITSMMVEKEAPDSELWNHISTIVNQTDNIPLGLYECPGPYKRLLSPEMMQKIANTDRFIYHKDTSCSTEAVAAKIDAMKGSPLGMFNAHTPDALFTLQHGGAGLSPIGANFYPEVYAFLVKNANKTRKADAVKKANDFLMKGEKVIGRKYPISAKYFMQLRGLPIELYAKKKRGALTEEEKQNLQGLWQELQTLSQEINMSLA